MIGEAEMIERLLNAKHKYLWTVVGLVVVAALLGLHKPYETSPEAKALEQIAKELHELNKHKDDELKQLKDLVDAVEECSN